MNTNEPNKILYKAVYKLLRPLVRIFLRNGMSFAAFAEIAKRAYVEIAENEFSVPGRKQTNSRISTITGLTRKEVHRIKAIVNNDSDDLIERCNRAARVVYGWVHNTRYSDDTNKIRDLVIEGETPSFNALVKEYSGDMPTRAILDELLQLGIVDLLEGGKIRLLERSYYPRAIEIDKFQYLGTDVSGLISTMDRNIHQKDKKPFFQRKVYYNNMPADAAEGLQNILADKGQYLLEMLDHWMAEHDRDISPVVKAQSNKTSGIGIYYFEDE